MKISNKIESYEKITELGLNKFPEKIFKNNEINEILEFIERYPAKYYAVRDKSKPGGIFKLKVEKENLFNEIKDYDLFSINVSSYNYINNQLLVGEIFISDNNVSVTLSTNSSYSVRDALKNPNYNFVTTIYDNELLNQIPYFDKIYEYIVKNKLKDVIVEFAYFNIPVGINNENIVVYELRTDYWYF